MILAAPSERIYVVVVKQGIICELYAEVLQSEREFAVLSRSHCCEISARKSSLFLSTVDFYETPVTTSKQTIDLYISIE